jgi:FMN-dependent NADH-azoreductase
MTRLLYIQASPRGGDSKSIQIANTYLQALRTNNASLQIETLELCKEALPPFDGDRAAAKMNTIGGQTLEGMQKTHWDEIVGIAKRFASADRYLFAVPMWNGGIPYRLKQYIDIVHQPGILWSLDAQTGYAGLLKDKHATLVLTAGVFGQGMPSPAFGEDFQATYLSSWLRQSGVTAIDEVRFQPSILTADAEGDLDRALDAARRLGHSHGRL